jgi:glyoxylase-like metal-dependent hydrolase (beta-lactamase superfamily II)
MSTAGMDQTFGALQLTVVQRDWLSSNNIVFTRPGGAAGDHGATVAVVDTGYDTHRGQTVALVEQVLAERGQGCALQLIVNTHLHSDHCGGNAALQARWPGARTLVPEGGYAAAQAWDESRLTFALTGQTCRPFRVDGCLRAGTAIELGGHEWQVHPTPGHDPDAVVLFEPVRRVLISGDALWRNRVAVIFPELDDEDGFGPALATLDLIERLDPAWVIPGHGEPFDAVADALAISRGRLRKLQADPALHARHSARVMLMFHMMEHRHRPSAAVRSWLTDTPLMRRPSLQRLLGLPPQALAQDIVQSLLDDGALVREGELIRLP